MILRAARPEIGVRPMRSQRDLSEQKMRAAMGGKWHSSSVSRLLQRLERLDRASNSRH